MAKLAYKTSNQPKLTINSGIEVTKERQSFEDLLDPLKDLYPPEELDQIRLAYDAMRALTKGKAKAKLLRPIKPIKEWVNDTYFVGPDGENIYDYWKDEIVKVFDRPKEERINQIILTGAYGTGKSTFAVLCIIRVIYELSCYENIAALFNLFGVSRIAFAYLSVTRTQAQATGFALLVEWLDSIPYFREMFQRRNGIDSMVIWPQERLIVTFGSVANHFIGMNLIGSILDEANFFSGNSREEGDFKMNTKVSSLYSDIITRSESRFIVNGINHSLSILVSSATVESSFTEEMIEKSKDDIHTHHVSPAVWDVKPHNYSGERFYVYVGGNDMDPFIVYDQEDFNVILNSHKKERLPGNLSLEDSYTLLPAEIKGKLVHVPEEHRKPFTIDIVAALQNLAGFSTATALKLFTSQTAYNSALHDGLEHPFSRPAITLSTTKEPTQPGYMPVKAYLKNGFKFRKPEMPRFFHLDLALTGDSAALASCYIDGWKTIHKQESNYGLLGDNEDQLIEDEIKVPIIAVDFMLSIDPPNKPNRISIGKIRDFIIYLKREHNIKIGKFTADQFQSEMLLQEFGELGINAGHQSVDRTADAYLALANLFYEERINTYHLEKFKHELFNVIYYPSKRKVDHPAKGSKDITDAVAGATFNAIMSEDKTDLDNDSLINIFTDLNTLSDEEDYESAVENVLKGLVSHMMQKR